MPPRAKVCLLPENIRAELERRLVKGGFAGYRELSAWLAGQGFEISKSSLHAFGQDFEERLGALKRVTEQARVIVAESPDADGAVNDALIRLVQEKAYAALMDMEIDPEEIDLTKLMRVIAELSRASVSQKRLMTEARASAQQDAAKAVDALGKTQGLSAETLKAIREVITGG